MFNLALWIMWIWDTIIRIADFLIWYYGGSIFYLICSLMLFILVIISLNIEINDWKEKKKKEKRDN